MLSQGELLRFAQSDIAYPGRQEELETVYVYPSFHIQTPSGSL